MSESIELKLTDGQVRDAIGGALLGLLTPERREEILKAAVADLFVAPRVNGFGDKGPSRIQSIVGAAVERVAEQIAKEWLDSQPDFRAKVENLLRDFVEKALTGDSREKIVNAMSDSLRRAITGERY